MKLRWLLWLPLLALIGCTIDSPAPVVPVDPTAAQALTPSPTLTATIAPTDEPSPTVAPTQPPESAPPTATVQPTQSPAADVSYCRHDFGPADGARFRARLSDVRTNATDQFDQVIFEFAELDGALHGMAQCLTAASWPVEADIGAQAAPGDALIAVDLPDWAHDDLFAASPLTDTTAITGGAVLDRVAFAANSLDSRGATLGVGLREPRPFRVRVEDARLIVEISRDATFPPDDDVLGTTEGTAPAIDQPVFFLAGGDVYRLANGRAQPVKQTPEQEIGLAVSPDGSVLAVCRAPADAEPFALPYGVRATLWTMRPDGSDEQQLADVGGCAEPSFATSGRTIAFTANVAASPPAVLQIWTVPVVGGDARPANTALDEWSRSQPRWLADGRLIYRAENAGQQVLFLRDDDGSEREITATLLSGQAYRGVGSFEVDHDSGQIAVEALRNADQGADLVVLATDGTQVAAEQRGFWQRPLSYVGGDLIYLTAECPAEAVLSYTLHRRSAQGTIDELARGSTAESIGAATATGDVLLYVRGARAEAGLRGPTPQLDTQASSAIWVLALDGSGRAEIYRADRAIDRLSAVVP